MKKKIKNPKEGGFKPPKKIIDAVKLIENWAKKQTDRDDWAIGEVACRRGFERLLKDIKMSDKKDSIFKPKSEAGKGDKPRSISSRYWDNYDQIDWSKKQNTSKRNGNDTKN